MEHIRTPFDASSCLSHDHLIKLIVQRQGPILTVLGSLEQREAVEEVNLVPLQPDHFTLSHPGPISHREHAPEIDGELCEYCRIMLLREKPSPPVVLREHLEIGG